jgi:hypothetical protein
VRALCPLPRSADDVLDELGIHIDVQLDMAIDAKIYMFLADVQADSRELGVVEDEFDDEVGDDDEEVVGDDADEVVADDDADELQAQASARNDRRHKRSGAGYAYIHPLTHEVPETFQIPQRWLNGLRTRQKRHRYYLHGMMCDKDDVILERPFGFCWRDFHNSTYVAPSPNG